MLTGDRNMNIETSKISIGYIYISIDIPRPPVSSHTQLSIITIEISSK